MLTGTAAHAAEGGFNDEVTLISAAPAPHDNKYTKIQWGGDIRRENCGAPLAKGGSLLLPTGGEMLFLDETTGEQTALIELPADCSTEYRGAVVGSRVVQPTENGVAVIDADSMRVVGSRSFDGNIASDCAVSDGLAYFSVSAGDGYEFLCVDLGSDGLDTVWSVNLDEQPTTPALQGDTVLWGCGDTLYTHGRREDTSHEIPLGKTISGAPFTTEYAVFFSTEDGNAGKLRLNPDGSLEEDTLTWCEVGSSPASPLSWNGRLYVPTADGFYILDNLNMEVSYIIPDIKGGCTPQVHYGNGPYIYTVAKREDKWAVYCVQDMEESAEPNVMILAQIENYAGGAYCVSDKGTMYFRDGIGRVYALTVAPFDVFSLVLRLVVLLALLVLVFFWLKKVAKRKADLRPKY